MTRIHNRARPRPRARSGSDRVLLGSEKISFGTISGSELGIFRVRRVCDCALAAAGWAMRHTPLCPGAQDFFVRVAVFRAGFQ